MKTTKATSLLKDGTAVTLRAAAESDAVNLVRLKKSYIKNTVSIPLYESEYTNSPEQEAALILRYFREENSILMVAEHGGELIGNIDLTGSQRKKLFHTGMIGMGLNPEWQNKGLGNLLMGHVLDWAVNNSPLSILWLDVYSTNAAGIRLYEKHGFEKCGVIHNFFKDDKPADKITMVKYINP